MIVTRYAGLRIERAMRIPMRASVFLLILCAAALATACAARLDSSGDAAVQAVFDQVKAHDFAAVEARLPPRLRTAVTDTRLQVEAGMIPDQPPLQTRLVSAETIARGEARETSMVREYLYPDRLLVVSTTVVAQPGKTPIVLGFNVQPFSRAALAVGRFSLRHKSSIQYFLLGLAAAIPLLLVWALAALARDRAAKWKWLWTLFILVGFTQLSVNWTTGALLFQPLSLLLLGASVGRGPLDVSPWVVTVSLPVGALAYLSRGWFRRRPEDIDPSDD
jgi:hypothetical protein